MVVVGGGVTGIFCAYYLAREGVSVTLIEKGELGSGSVHAAGLIEPNTYYQINNWRYVRDVFSFARRGVLRFRRVSQSWLLSYLSHFGERLQPDDTALLSQMSDYSVSEYMKLGEEDPAWGYTQPGLLELYEEKRSFEQALGSLKTKTGWRQVEMDGYAGGIVYDDVGVVVTEMFVKRMGEELKRLNVEVVHAKAGRVGLDGRVETPGKMYVGEKTIVAAGVESRKLGVPITPVGGVGYRLKPTGSGKRPKRPIIVYERSLAVVWAEEWVKVTVGLDFGFKPGTPSLEKLSPHIERFVGPAQLIDAKTGVRPCSPDGLPVVGAKDRLIVATGGFRLGWSFAPAIARAAADLALGKSKGHPRLSRYTGNLHSGVLG
ncbi:MAG: FAD-binding oxidoreductase [Thermoprotei archaeon]